MLPKHATFMHIFLALCGDDVVGKYQHVSSGGGFTHYNCAPMGTQLYGLLATGDATQAAGSPSANDCCLPQMRESIPSTALVSFSVQARKASLLG
jgi:hypothetical protein